MTFNDINSNMDKNFHCLTRLIYINNIIKIEYNTLFKLNKNYINFDYQISEEEEKLIKNKNKAICKDLEYKKIEDSNFGNIFYGFFEYDPEGCEKKFRINGFGIKVNNNCKYIGEFKNGVCHGYGVYYFNDGSFKLTKTKNETVEAFKFYNISGEIQFCLYNSIIENYQKYGLSQIILPNGIKRINFIKNNNFDDYGIEYNSNGELYEGYYLSGAKHGYGILNSESKKKIGLFYKNELKFGEIIYTDWIIQGEFNMGLKDGYIIEYDQLKKIQFQGKYKNGKKEGIGISYYNNGNISYKGYFKNNLEDIFGFFYNSSGKLFYFGNIDKGQKKRIWDLLCL